jgi:hypothetical protein
MKNIVLSLLVKTVIFDIFFKLSIIKIPSFIIPPILIYQKYILQQKYIFTQF